MSYKAHLDSCPFCGKTDTVQLIPHGVGNDDDGTFFCIAYMLVIEVSLERNLLKCLGFPNSFVPFRHDLGEEFIGVDVLLQRF